MNSPPWLINAIPSAFVRQVSVRTAELWELERFRTACCIRVTHSARKPISGERFDSLLDEVDDMWIDIKAARLALQQLSFGVASSSTRSVMALLGYLQWRRLFVDRCAEPKDAIDDGFFQALAP